ncbi:hypothetical protein ACQPW1_21995 [Nocardia sp. CA-128927]|uniref:hypothetical protein n=1 Tax=Nocardia sp. CA-128927 TaxID=3239975 RepID=UPI003D98D416
MCEAVYGELRERKMLSGNVYDNARRLRALGSVAADRFFADVETSTGVSLHDAEGS